MDQPSESSTWYAFCALEPTTAAANSTKRATFLTIATISSFSTQCSEVAPLSLSSVVEDLPLLFLLCLLSVLRSPLSLPVECRRSVPSPLSAILRPVFSSLFYRGDEEWPDEMAGWVSTRVMIQNLQTNK